VVMFVSVLPPSPLSSKVHVVSSMAQCILLSEKVQKHMLVPLLALFAELPCYRDQLRFDRCEFLTISQLSLNV
jgi:hypothetical protein